MLPVGPLELLVLLPEGLIVPGVWEVEAVWEVEDPMERWPGAVDGRASKARRVSCPKAGRGAS